MVTFAFLFYFILRYISGDVLTSSLAQKVLYNCQSFLSFSTQDIIFLSSLTLIIVDLWVTFLFSFIILSIDLIKSIKIFVLYKN